MASIKDEIKSVYIKNIKGYNSNGKLITFKNKDGQGLLSNKLNIVVATNGFGKSSLAIALSSTSNGRKIHLNKKAYFKEDDSLDAELKIKCKLNDEEKELTANESLNEINKIFDIFTINSHLDTKGIRGQFRGANSDLIIKDIELMQVPNTVSTLDYNIRDINICLNEKNLEKLNKTKINNYINKLIRNKEIYSYIELLEKYSKFRANKELLENPAECNDIDQENINYFIAILEIYKIDKKNFKQYVEYQIYKSKYEFAKEILNNIKTFKNFELKIKKEGDKLLVKLPKATVISNGQRDVIVFLANLLKLKFNFLTSNKEYGILVIDEVFDYLDDANLLIAQYYLVNFIQEISKTNKKLFIIFLTHLAPNNFNHFYFNRKHFKKVFYLDVIPKSNEEITDFLKKREDIKKSSPDTYNIMSKFLHYRVEKIDLPDIGRFSVSFSNNEDFMNILKKEYRNYYKGKTYCPFSVAIYLRIFVEHKVYSVLSNDFRSEYLNHNTTIKKLEFAKEKDVEIDEKFYLLSAVYNEMVHNNKEILYFKLNNEIIKNLIISVIGEL
jgi:predicted Zn-ribbon and HTH transcriptional regulator